MANAIGAYAKGGDNEIGPYDKAAATPPSPGGASSANKTGPGLTFGGMGKMGA